MGGRRSSPLKAKRFLSSGGVLGCGIGNQLAVEISVGMFGKFELQSTEPMCKKLGVEGKIGAQITVVGFATAPIDIWSGAYWIKNTDLGIDRLGLSVLDSPMRMLSEGTMALTLTDLDTRQFQPLGRDYLKRNNVKALAMAAPMSSVLELTGGSETVLVTDGYPYPEPAVVAAGATNHVLYVRDNTGRLAENRTELVDVYNPGGGWSAAAPVGTGTFGESLQTALSNGVLRYCDIQFGLTNRFYRVRLFTP